MLSNCSMSGAFFETYVISEIIKNFYAYNIDPKNFRNIDLKEVDLIYALPNALYPTEIKKVISIYNQARILMFFLNLKKRNKKGLLITTSDKIRPINEYVYSISVYLI